MAYFGEIERRNLHGLICVPVLPKSLAGIDIHFFRCFVRLFAISNSNFLIPTNPIIPFIFSPAGHLFNPLSL